MTLPLPRALTKPRTGKAWTPTSFRRAWESACERAGLPALKAYETLRHSTATEWLRGGASEREVQALLGHKTGYWRPDGAEIWLAGSSPLNSMAGWSRERP